MRALAWFGISITLSILGTGCSGASSNSEAPEAASSKFTVENPTGTCAAPDSGGRAGYHHPGDSQWLPDCENPLAREYFRVFATKPDSAYLVPRPDGDVGLEQACTNERHPLHDVVIRHALCQPASTPAEVERANSLRPGDALAIAHELHASLRFMATDEGVGITPFPIPSDIVDACNLHSNADIPELDAICRREEERLRSGNEVAFSYVGPGGVALAKRLNELYAIPLD